MIAKLLNELEYRRIEAITFERKETQYKSLVEKYTGVINSLKEVNRQYEKQIEISKPEWWDKFTVGFVGGFISAVVVIWILLTTVSR